MNLIDQPLLLRQFEIEFSDASRHLYASPRESIASMDVSALLGTRGTLERRSLLRRQQIKRGDLIDLLERLLCLRFDLFLEQLLVVKPDDFLDRPGVVAQVLPNPQQFLQNERRTCNGFQNEQI